MPKVHKLMKGAQTIYPATIYDAIVNPNTRKSLTTELSELEKKNEGLEKKNEELNSEVVALDQQLTGGNITISTILNLPPTVNDESKGCWYLEKTGLLSNMYNQFTFTTKKIGELGKYEVFAKIGMVAGSSDRQVSTITKITPMNDTGAFTTNTHILKSGDVKTVHCGTLDVTSPNGYFNLIFCYFYGVTDLSGKVLNTTETVRIEYYGMYIVPEAEIPSIDMDVLAEKLNYSSDSSVVYTDGIMGAIDKIKEKNKELESSIDNLSADSVYYNNSISSLQSNTVQEAIDELSRREGESKEEIEIASVLDTTYANSTNEKDESLKCAYASASKNLHAVAMSIRIKDGYTNLKAGKYAVFAKLRLLLDNPDRKANVISYPVFITGSGSFVNAKTYVKANMEAAPYYLGDIVVTSDGFQILNIAYFLAVVDSAGDPLTALENVRMEYYGGYIIDKNMIKDVDYGYLTKQLDYSKSTCVVKNQSETEVINEQIEDLYRKVEESNIRKIDCYIRFHGHSIWWYDGKELSYSPSAEDVIDGEIARGYQSRILEQFKFKGRSQCAVSGLSLGGLSKDDEGSMMVAYNTTKYGMKFQGELGDIWTLDSITNDFSRSIPIGSIDDYKNNTGITTYYGALRAFKEKALELSGENVIVVVSNACRRNTAGGTSESENKVGHSLLDYEKAVMRVVKLNPDNWYFVDQYRCGVTDETLDETTIDGLHLNNLGYSLAVRPWLEIMGIIYNKLIGEKLAKRVGEVE